MLTVKHMEVTGAEVVYSAVKAGYQPRTKSEDGHSAAYVFIEDPKGERVALGNWGTFYIVNEVGKTVAKYELGGWSPERDPEIGKVYPPIAETDRGGLSPGRQGVNQMSQMSLRTGADGSLTATRVG